jgi:hypothetical protein
MSEPHVIRRRFLITFCLFVFIVSWAFVPISPAYLPPVPEPHPPSGVSFGNLIKGYEAFKTLLKLFIVACYVVARGFYPFLITEDRFQGLNTALDF